MPHQCHKEPFEVVQASGSYWTPLMRYFKNVLVGGDNIVFSLNMNKLKHFVELDQCLLDHQILYIAVQYS